MQTMTPEQHSRIQKLVASLKTLVPPLWLTTPHMQTYDSRVEELFWTDTAAQALLQGLLRSMGSKDILGQSLAELLVYPDAHDLPRHLLDGEPGMRLVSAVGHVFAVEWVARYGDTCAIDLLAARLRHLIRHSFSDPETSDATLRLRRNMGDAYIPHIHMLARLLVRLREHPAALEPLEELVRGRWATLADQPSASGEASGSSEQANAIESGRKSLVRGLRPKDWKFLHEGNPDPTQGSRNVLDRLYLAGRLDSACLSDVVRYLPEIVPTSLLASDAQELQTARPFNLFVYQTLRDVLWQGLHQEWTEPHTRWLLDMAPLYSAPSGAQWLLRVCERVEQLGLTALVQTETDSYPERLLNRMAGLSALMPDESPDEVIARLKNFQPSTLLAVLPRAQMGEDMVLAALGWPDAQVFLKLLRQISRQSPNMAGFESTQDVPNSVSPKSGVVDRQAVLDVLSTLGEARIRSLVKVFRASKLPVTNSLTLMEAVWGWNRKSVESSVIKHGQVAMKAYGLLPLQREDEALERYVRLKDIAKEASKYGQERQANTRAASEAGIANLAQTAGFADAGRFEWAMEARLSHQGMPLNERQTVGDWEVELKLANLEPQLHVYKDGKRLRTTPAGLRKNGPFLSFKETQTQLKAQYSRFRASLERMMTEEESFTAADLKQWTALPVVVDLLQHLVLRTSAGSYGFWRVGHDQLTGLNGVVTALDTPSCCIAHAHHLFQDGVLADWQREVVRLGMVQPFKQVFRELYVLTPAEQDTRTFSDRFAGQVLNSRVASRLLQARGWHMTSGEGVQVYKRFPKAQLVAEMDFPGAGHYLAEIDEVLTDRIHFWRKNEESVALADVPALVFSEVMRDADLLVSVAQAENAHERWFSTETYQRRADLVSSLMAVMGLDGVRCEGHFAHVSGKRANYRVHLGSAVIHIEPGHYLCVVPDRMLAGQASTCILPFADAEDKTSEVISKILLLRNDDKIKDASILHQINATYPASRPDEDERGGSQ